MLTALHPFLSRRLAGRALGDRLAPLWGERPVVVAASARGIPVAFEVARALGAPLDLLLTHHLLDPRHPELPIGALVEDGTSFADSKTAHILHLEPRRLSRIAAREKENLRRQGERLHGHAPWTDVRGKTVLVVDDGVCTGVTAFAVIRALRRNAPRRIILAVPVLPATRTRALEEVADRVVTLASPRAVFALDEWYAGNDNEEDAELAALLHAGATNTTARRRVEVPVPWTMLPGELVVPRGARAAVIVPQIEEGRHASAGELALYDALSRLFVTLRVSLGGAEAALDHASLAARLEVAERWLAERPEARGLRVACAASGVASVNAALWNASRAGARECALVLRNGRPDVCGPRLGRVLAPTLLMVDSAAPAMLAANRGTMAQMSTEVQLLLLTPEESIAGDRAGIHACEWIQRHCAAP